MRADELADRAVRLSRGGTSLAKALNLHAMAKGDAGLITRAYGILAAHPDDEHAGQESAAGRQPTRRRRSRRVRPASEESASGRSPSCSSPWDSCSWLRACTSSRHPRIPYRRSCPDTKRAHPTTRLTRVLIRPPSMPITNQAEASAGSLVARSQTAGVILSGACAFSTGLGLARRFGHCAANRSATRAPSSTQRSSRP
jgi:hypothetical protein